MNKKIENIIIAGGLALIGLNTYGLYKMSKNPFTDRVQMEEFFDEEVRTLDLEDKNIEVIVTEEEGDVCSIGCSWKTSDGYIIYLRKKEGLENGFNEEVLKHELYHIADGHCDETFALVKSLRESNYSEDFIRLYHDSLYITNHEPQAIMYSIFGLRL
ncbi:MAG: hypothetical protein Q8Q35_03055 [Nanoarchaeota archaeon]|nr:hypothetical protein [Nanoarchaeota archaeon]